MFGTFNYFPWVISKTWLCPSVEITKGMVLTMPIKAINILILYHTKAFEVILVTHTLLSQEFSLLWYTSGILIVSLASSLFLFLALDCLWEPVIKNENIYNTYTCIMHWIRKLGNYKWITMYVLFSIQPHHWKTWPFVTQATKLCSLRCI